MKITRAIVDLSSFIMPQVLSTASQSENYHPDEVVNLRAESVAYTTITKIMDAILGYGFTPNQVILVVEGANNKEARRKISLDYKANRPKKSDEDMQVLKNATLRVCAAFKDAGAITASQNGVESDDVIAYLAKTLTHSKMVFTSDNDLLQLSGVNNTVVWVKGAVDTNPYGNFPLSLVHLYKALCGDSSDGYKGVVGFGNKAFLNLVAKFSLEELAQLEDLVIDNKVFGMSKEWLVREPALQKVREQGEAAQTSWSLAQLKSHLINLPNAPIFWEAGHVQNKTHYTHQKLVKFSAQQVLVTNTNYEEVFKQILPELKKSRLVALDIETATSENSDKWLARREESKRPLDVFGSELVGLGLTFGSNGQYSIYIDVNHVGGVGVPTESISELLSTVTGCFVVHNASFELTVLHQVFGKQWKDNGFRGFLPRVIDTVMMASYVNENDQAGLKHLSWRHLNYKQTDYETVTQGRKMSEMTAEETFEYGADDTRCTYSLFNYFHLRMNLEHTWEAFLQIETLPAYLTAKAFLDGVRVDLKELRKQAQEDAVVYEENLSILHEYLQTVGWEGSTYQPLTQLNPTDIRRLYCEIVEELHPEPLARKLDKLATPFKEKGFDAIYEAILNNDLETLNEALQGKFSPNIELNLNSPKQLSKLMYEVMKLPVRITNPPTDKAKEQDTWAVGSPKTDEDAIDYALAEDVQEGSMIDKALRALLNLKRVETRRKLFYEPYQNFPHWKDGLIHASLRQCSTVTRRYSSANPNLQQLPKATGELRKIFLPHTKTAVIVSLDFSAQELRVIADYSRDPALLSCYVGDNRRDMHSITGAGIAGVSYEKFVEVLSDPEHKDFKDFKSFRAQGKAVNFASEYGVGAKKMGLTLRVSKDTAQEYLDRKYAAFAKSEEWKDSVIAEGRTKKYVTTKMGVRRHLTNLGNGDNRDERQAVNFKIQGSSAEMTKLAMSRMWKAPLFEKYDCQFIAPIHDEVVFSVEGSQAFDFICEVHKCMVQPYADMTVPIESSVSLGKNFGEQIECNLTRADIEAAVKTALGELENG